MHRKVVHSLWLFVCLLLLGTQPVYAYLDPGAGSYLIQLLVAGVLGASFTARLYWRKIASYWSSFFRGHRNQGPDDC
jgi:hypothetical protein